MTLASRPRMRTLTRRLVLLTAGVACFSTLLTAFLLVNLARQAAVEAAQTILGRDADVLATIVRNSATQSTGLDIEAVRRAYDRRGIATAVVDTADTAAVGALARPFRAEDVLAVTSGATVSRTGRGGGEVWLVEGRGAGDSAVLVALRRADAISFVPAPRWRIVFAIVVAATLAGLGGVLIARALSRPLVRLDAAARRLSAGERGIHVEPDGPVEIADLAEALNTLSQALAVSEERQRRFLLTVSHELRTPLTAVAGYAEALADGVVTGEKAREAARVVLDESARLQRRVEELLALARLEADDVGVDLADVDAAALLLTAAQAWAARSEAVSVPVRVDAATLADGPVMVRADPERLRQSVDALTDNALRVLADLPEPGTGVVLAARREGAVVVVEVRDSGPGLDPEDLALAFEPGALRERYRGRRPVGSGVGLALVGRLAGLMGGRAIASRAPEGGLVVALHLQAV